jgi:hypothetical protein
MAGISVGAAATNRAYTIYAGYTNINMDYAATASGILKFVDLWFNTNASSVKVATFSMSGTTFTPRSVVTIGAVTAGSKQTFNVNLVVNIGDYIGYYASAGLLEQDSSGGSGIYYKSGDQTGGATRYTLDAGSVGSIYGYGPVIERTYSIVFGV